MRRVVVRGIALSAIAVIASLVAIAAGASEPDWWYWPSLITEMMVVVLVVEWLVYNIKRLTKGPRS